MTDLQSRAGKFEAPETEGEYAILRGTVPVSEIVLADGRSKLQPAARLSRLQDQMHLRIMPERLEVSHTFHPVEDGFLIDDTALFKRGFHAEPFPDQITQHLDLYLTHQLGMNLEREHPGVLTGAPITDMRITLAAGRAHKKHTEGGDFRQAT